MRGRVLILIGAIILLVVVVIVVLMNRETTPEESAATATAEVTDGGVLTPVPGGEVGVTTEDRVFIVVAIQDLPRGLVIPENGVALQPWPADTLAEPESYFTDVADVVGKIARTDIFRGSPMLRKYVVENLYDIARTGSDAAALLAGLPDDNGENYVAISLPLDPSGFGQVAYGIQDGDYVDVILSLLFVDVDTGFQTRLPNTFSVITRLETGELSIGAPRQGRPEASTLSPEGVLVGPSELSQRPRLMTVLTVRDAFVVHVGEFPPGGTIIGATPTPMVVAPPPAPPGEGTTQTVPTALPSATPYAPLMITLAVQPQDALTLVWALDSQIPITFALREAGNHNVYDATPVTLEYMLNRFTLDANGNPQVPRSLPYALEPPITSVRRFDLSTLYHFLGSSVGAAAEEQNQ